MRTQSITHKTVKGVLRNPLFIRNVASERAAWIKAVRKDWILLTNAPYDIIDDRDTMKKIIDIEPCCLTFSSPRLYTDKLFMLHALEYAYAYGPKIWKTNERIAKAAVRLNPWNFTSIADSLTNNLAIAILAVKQVGCLLIHVPKELVKANKQLIYLSAKAPEEPMPLLLLSSEYQSDPDMVACVVAGQHDQIRYVSSEMCRSIKFWTKLQVVMKCPSAFKDCLDMYATNNMHMRMHEVALAKRKKNKCIQCLL